MIHLIWENNGNFSTTKAENRKCRKYFTFCAHLNIIKIHFTEGKRKKKVFVITSAMEKVEVKKFLPNVDLKFSLSKLLIRKCAFRDEIFTFFLEQFL